MRCATVFSAILAIGAMAACQKAETGGEKQAAAPPAEQPANAPKVPTTDEELVQSAMSAAPASVGEGATIVAMDASGAMRTVRKGVNNFTCMADNPHTPGPDPMCGDANAMKWAEAWMGKKPPPPTAGFMYMLAGGTDASNTDPHATQPTSGGDWIHTGPHVMMVGPKEITLGYPSGPAPDTKQPYVMWAGTPYAHLMIPVR